MLGFLLAGFLALALIVSILIYPLVLFPLGREAATTLRPMIAAVALIVAFVGVVGLGVASICAARVEIVWSVLDPGPIRFDDGCPGCKEEVISGIKQLQEAVGALKTLLAGGTPATEPSFVKLLGQTDVGMQKVPDYMCWVDFELVRDSLDQGEIDRAQASLDRLMNQLVYIEQHDLKQ
jgi:hypothetical protein